MLKLAFPIVLVASLLCAPPAAMAGIIYSGELVWEATQAQIVATDGWGNPDTTIGWEVENLGGGQWSYSYEITVPRKALSHLIFEISENLDEIDNVVIEVVCDDGNDFHVVSTFGTYNSGNPSNPGIPGEMHGIKFDIVDDDENDECEALDIYLSFTAAREPMWGDFYAKDGTDGGQDVYMYNAGFTSPDPDILVFGPDSDLVTDHILVPDTIPEPTALVLLLLGGVVMSARNRRKGAPQH